MLRWLALFAAALIFVPLAASTQESVEYGPFGPCPKTNGGSEVGVGTGRCATFSFAGGSWFDASAQDLSAAVFGESATRDLLVLQVCEHHGAVESCTVKVACEFGHFAVDPTADSVSVIVTLAKCDHDQTGGKVPPVAGSITLTTDGAPGPTV